MNKISKILIIILIILIIIIGLEYYLLTPNRGIISNNESKVLTIEDILKNSFIDKAQIKKNPARLYGKVSISDQELKDIIYTIANKNDIYELKKVYTFIDKNKILLVYPYKIFGFINTQLQISINPKIINNNLELILSDAKIGKINISDKIISNNIKLYKDKIPFDIKGNVITVSKNYTYPITLNNIDINNKNIIIDLEIYANNFIDFITKYGINTIE